MDDGHTDNICRVCRSESTPDRPLYYPCVCTGSIKYIHQECLVQWLKYSKKEYCELCKHRFAFTPIYSPDMPKRLPVKDIITGLFRSVGRAVLSWLHYTLVAIAWLGVVPLTACRIYRCLFTSSPSSVLTMPLDILSTDNLLTDCFQGCFVVTCTLCTFICLVWLREQILHGGGPDWLEQGNQPNLNNDQAAVAQPGNVGDQNGPQDQAALAADDDLADDLGALDEDDEEEEEAQNDAGNGNAVQEDNWNPIEWERAAEELTWERLLGLDGSLVFLEHVFWVVSLNTLFILVFAFCPYYIGQFTIYALNIDDMVSATQFKSLMTTLLGYFLIAFWLMLLHSLASLAALTRTKRILGICYMVVKVSLLVVVEIGLFPLICGWWLDICSLSMFDATLKERHKSFNLAPGTFIFIRWLVGMVYVFYFASFILLLREVLRPGVLWFLRNLNDPDFNPIQEMIHLPIYRHVRRFLASMVIFGTTVLVMLWLPIRTVKYLLPLFLPYNVMMSSDTPVSELSLELLLLQVVLPALLEQGHTRLWLKSLVRGWCVGVAWLLGIRSYLLGDVPLGQNDKVVHMVEPGGPGAVEAPWAPQQPAPPPADNPPHQAEGEQAGGDNLAAPHLAPAPLRHNGLGAAHQAMLQGGGPTGYQPYKMPNLFYVRLQLLCVLMCVTLFLASLVSLVVPVFIGRTLMSLWMGEAKIHELYTTACGLYTCWVTLRAGTILYHWVPQGWSTLFSRIRDWSILAAKSFVIAAVLIGLVPLLLGLLFELVIVAPLRVPLDQTPVFYPWQDWALGVLHAKIICAVTMMGPRWWLRRVIEQMYNAGLRNMDLTFILRQLCAPVIGCLGMALSLPYIFAKSIVPAFGRFFDASRSPVQLLVYKFGPLQVYYVIPISCADFETQNLVLRRVYPLILAVITIFGFCIFQATQFKKLYEHIKNDKYLVGQRLVNYEHRTAQAQQEQARDTATA